MKRRLPRIHDASSSKEVVYIQLSYAKRDKNGRLIRQGKSVTRTIRNIKLPEALSRLENAFLGGLAEHRDYFDPRVIQLFRSR